jgi:hypothetical protein
VIRTDGANKGPDGKVAALFAVRRKERKMPKAVDVGDGREIRRSAAGQPILASNRPNKFGAKVRKAFLAHLAGSCNVSASCRAAGCSVGAVNYWQNVDSEFAAACDDALAIGYKQLQHIMLQRALHGNDVNKLSEADFDAVPDASTVDTDLALRLMAMHERRVKTGARRGGGKARSKATREETDAAILKRLKVLRIRFERNEE